MMDCLGNTIWEGMRISVRRDQNLPACATISRIDNGRVWIRLDEPLFDVNGKPVDTLFIQRFSKSKWVRSLDQQEVDDGGNDS